MALINCPDCGKEFSDKATACPNCGCPLEIKKIPVYFKRKKAFSGSAISGNVFVDGAIVGSAGNGAEFKLMLSPGQHSIQVDSKVQAAFSAVNSRSKMLNIPENAKRVDVEIKVDNSLSFSSFFGVGGTPLLIGEIIISK